APVRLTVRDCAIAPAVAVVRGAGGALEVQTQDDAAHAVVLDELGPLGAQGLAAGAPRSTTRARLPAWGHTISLPLPDAGVRRVVADGGDPAYVVVTEEDAALTGDDGAAALEQVPAGTYTVLAWLPPSAGQPAVLATGQATVVAGARAELTLKLGS
ncbi:MAG TPA: hypothetical protein VHE35_28860, partial [Kofleriaceae bacterium]|nr:hypothetical protein [Kofleriaceae bacterium]